MSDMEIPGAESGTNIKALVSTSGMGLIRRCLSLSAAVLALSSSARLQTVGNPRTAIPGPSCPTDKPVYVGRDHKPLWFDTESLVRNATHCAAPQKPGMLDHSRLDGYVVIDILVDDEGRVSCARVISGHPLLFGSAIEAVKDWAFRPKRQDGRPVWFYGRLRFHIVDRGTQNAERSCTVAQW